MQHMQTYGLTKLIRSTTEKHPKDPMGPREVGQRGNECPNQNEFDLNISSRNCFTPGESGETI